MAQLHDTGEQFNKKYIFTDEVSKPANLQVGLYSDSSDQLSDEDDIDDIQSEPDDGNYVRQDVPFDDTGFQAEQPGGAGTPWEANTTDDIVFDLEDTTGEVDYYFVVVEYEAEGDTGAQDHLYWTGELSQEYALDSLDQLTILPDPGVGLDQD